MGRRKALDTARTQHRQKTADELGRLADAIVETLGEGEDDVGLERVREESGKDVQKVRSGSWEGVEADELGKEC